MARHGIPLYLAVHFICAWWGANTTNVRLGPAIMQMSARTPTAAAMAAITLDHLSNEGFFSFSTEFVYALESSEIPVYMIKLENIALEFRFLIHEAMIDQDDLPRINRTEASQETPTK